MLQALAAGLSDREIAHRLHVSTETVRTHMVNVLRKLEVDSRLKALVFAVQHRLVSIDALARAHRFTGRRNGFRV